MAHAWVEYSRVYLAELSPATALLYELALRVAVAELPPAPTRGDVEIWMRGCRPRLAVGTVNTRLRAVRAVTRAAATLTHDHELADVMRSVKPIKQTASAPRCPPLDCPERAMAILEGPGEHCFILLASHNGLRLGELLGLRPDDYQARTHVLQVTRQRHSATNRIEPRKNGRPHACEADKRTARELRQVLGHPAELVSEHGRRTGQTDGFIFPWSHRKVDSMMARLRAGLGRDASRYFPGQVAWHAFRHWGATREAERTNGNILAVARWLGDSSLNAAMGYCDQVRGVRCVTSSAPDRERE